MTKDTTEKKEELIKFFNSPEVRHSIENTLLSRKTMQLLTEIAQPTKETKEPENKKESEKTKKEEK
jgi:hypothetical protein